MVVEDAVPEVLGDSVCDALCVTLGVKVTLGVRDWVFVIVWDADRDCVFDWDLVFVCDADWDCVLVCDLVGLCV